MSKIITKKDMEERLKNNIGTEYILIDYISGKYNKSKIKHVPCGHIYEIQNQQINNATYDNHKGRCPFCFNNGRLFSDEKIQHIIFSYLDESYTLVKYINKKLPIEIFHQKCKNNISLYLRNIYKGQRCPICENGFIKMSQNRTYKFDDFSKIVKEKTDGKIELQSYNGYRERCDFFCNDCSKSFELTPLSFTKRNEVSILYSYFWRAGNN